MVGVCLGAYLLLLLLTGTPWAQRWLAERVSSVLTEELRTEVQVGRIQLGLFNRVVVDDLLLRDQQNDTLLAATRLSAKVELIPLLQGRYHITNAQLFGYDIQLRKADANEPYNFQFIIDKLSNPTEEDSPLDLSIESVIIRRGRLRHDVLSQPVMNGFDLAHIALEDLAMRLALKVLLTDSLKLNIKELSFRDSRSGLIVNRLRTDIAANLSAVDGIAADMSDFLLQLPASDIQIPHLQVQFAATPDDSTSLQPQTLQMELNGKITPADLSPFFTSLKRCDKAIDIHALVNLRDDSLELHDLKMQAPELLVRTDALAYANGTPLFPLQSLSALTVDANLHPSEMGAEWFQRILQTLADATVITAEQAETLGRLGSLELQGHVLYQPERTMAEMKMGTSIGSAELTGTLNHSDEFTATLMTKELLLAKLFSNDNQFLVDDLSLTAQAEGSLTNKNVHIRVETDDFLFRGERMGQMQTDATLSPHSFQLAADLTHPQMNGRITAHIESADELTPTTETLEQATGFVRIEDLHVQQREHRVDVTDLRVTVNNDTQGHHLNMRGDFIDAQLDGRFHYSTLSATMQHILHDALPSLIQEPSTPLAQTNDELDFNVKLWNTDSLFSLVGISVCMPEAILVQGRMDGNKKALTINADAPQIRYGNEDLRSVSLIAHQQKDYLRTFVTLQRWMEEEPIDITLTTEAEKDQLETFLTWDNHQHPEFKGQLSANARFELDSHRDLRASVHITPSQIVIADTTWNIHGSELTWNNKQLNVEGFKVSQLGRHLLVNGVMSENPHDTLFADLRGINLEYVFGLLDFHDVELAGAATGKINASNLIRQPVINANLDVKNFHFENALLGDLSVTGGWGRTAPGSIDLNAYITEPLHQRLSHVRGTITPGHDAGSGLDLDVEASNLNVGFITEYARSIFQDFLGRATGHARINGPFNALDLNGAVAMDTLAMTIDVLGTRYHSTGGDSVWLEPDGIRVRSFEVFDRFHKTDGRAHSASVEGTLTWNHFKNLRYAFDIQAHDLLGYDFHDFGDEVFYGTVFAEGTCRLTGDADQLTVDLHGRPTAGTVFTYNASTPETLTDNQFITFVKRDTVFVPEQSTSSQSSTVTAKSDEPLDIRISFDMEVTPEAQIRLLMDPRSEDYITLYGNGGIRATYFNKGRFQMFGTYHVDRGTYRLSLQDIIRKDFLFQQGGTIVFGGAPMKAGLNLQAIYTVPSVSLNDLAAGSNFSSSNVRVNCLMNISGLAEQPQVTFDFDIPNVNEDEKQMVRALISTDEERNLQVIYLLGIGRFYTYGLDAGQDQTNTAMQSLLSSTLSGQLNELLSSAIGTGNWNFGTNLSTGQLGWSDMDVEGMLSGRLLNNRLLINGTFGYRDTPVANTNFIGDFDVQWLLMPQGTVSLKAYSETNDRYFTKTALTTQGVGVLVRKDFNSLRNLFRTKQKQQ